MKIDLEKCTEDAILEIFELVIQNKKYNKYLPEIRKVLRERLNTHEQLVKDFSPYGTIQKMNLTTQDFTESCK